MWGNGGGMFFGGAFMWLFWILLIVVVVFLIRLVVGRRGDTTADDGESPIQILERRFARGEIDEAEFKRRRAELER